MTARGLLAGAVAVLALAGAAPTAQAAAAPRDLGSGAGLTGLTAVDGHLVASRHDPRTKRWALVQVVGRRVTQLPVPTRAVPFDADAGTDAAGRPVVAFSVCAQDPPAADPQAWTRARGCAIASVPLDAPAAPQPVPGGAEPRASATTPSLWRGRLAFARHVDGATLSDLRLVAPDGTTAPLAAPEVACDLDCDDRGIVTTVTALDLGERAAVVLADQAGGETFGISGVSTLQLDPLGAGKPTVLSQGFVDGACGYVQPTSPSVRGAGALWVAAGSTCDETDAVLGVVGARGTARRELRDPGRLTASAAQDGRTTWWLRARRGRYVSTSTCLHASARCRLVATRAPALRAVPRNRPIGPYPEDS